MEIQEFDEDEDVDTKPDGDDGDTIMDSEEDVMPTRNLRRSNDRAAERKRKFEEDRKRKEKVGSGKTKATKEAKQLEKILKKIEEVKDQIRECEEEVETCDNDLRENDCPRTRVLGKDRFWNRYYWFERNAMPYGGLPDSSTAHAGYANGCIWVQGPDEIERVGFIDLDDADNARYKAAFGITVPQRKLKEEGATHTFTAHQWGYYEDPEDLEKLVSWLSDKGSREIKLKKELLAQRDHIATHMKNRRAYLDNDQPNVTNAGDAVSRISTRTKSYVDPNGPRFLSWKNTTAVREQGHLHSEPSRTQRKGIARPVNGKKAAVEEVRQTRASGRQAKPVGRQGTRYHF